MGQTSKGIKIINKAIGQFQSIISQLNDGVSRNDAEVVANNVAITSITAKNEALDASSAEAKTFSTNLQGMLSNSNPVEALSVEADTTAEEEGSTESEAIADDKQVDG